ncbi:hypothetical protein XELAEV_18031932mg [Xenopus laevis]|uniref:G-protein coupled receptors family 1 profile domain-containing protein n=1 Tax=Xenopus laevis TaxID=8355 RepID=A0A974HG62_XENLA|nr:hypothetical protein XELAEV_18031932mg [Xenopus laevis]
MKALTLYDQAGGNASAANEYAVIKKQSEGISILLTVLLSLIVLLIVLGNSVVILAFIVDRRLRTRSNFFLLNLSICDFLVGAASISMYIPYKVTGKWMIGMYLCKLWITIDYTITTASAYSVVLISYDRFLSVNEALMILTLCQMYNFPAVNVLQHPTLLLVDKSPAVPGTKSFVMMASLISSVVPLLTASSLE